MAEANTLAPLRLTATSSTPLVQMDASGRMVMHGRAMPIDAASFFQPILEWLSRYSKQASGVPVFEIRLDYFNSGSSLQMARLVHALGDIPHLEVHWYHHPDDEDIEEAGRELARLARVPFKFFAAE